MKTLTTKDRSKIYSRAMAAMLVKNATLKVQEGRPHGMPITHVDVTNKDLLASSADRLRAGCRDRVRSLYPHRRSFVALRCVAI